MRIQAEERSTRASLLPACPRIVAGLLTAFLLVGFAPWQPGLLLAEDAPTEEAISAAWDALLSAESSPIIRGAGASTLLLAALHQEELQTRIAERLSPEQDVVSLAALLEMVAHTRVYDGLTNSLLFLRDDTRSTGGESGPTIAQLTDRALASILQSERQDGLAGELITRVISDSPSGVRSHALEVLGQNRPRAALPRLAEIWRMDSGVPAEVVTRIGEICRGYFADPDERLRDELVSTAERLVDSLAATGKIEEVTPYLEHRLIPIAQHAIETLKRAGKPEVLAAVTAALGHWAEIHAALEPPLDGLLELHRTLMNGASPEQAEQAALALVELLGPTRGITDPALRLELCQALVLRPAVARALPDHAAAGAMLPAFREEGDVARRQRYVEIFRDLSDTLAALELLSTLDFDPPVLQAKILRSLLGYTGTEFQGVEVERQVLSSAASSDPQVREAALQAIDHLDFTSDMAFERILAIARDPELANLQATRAQACRLLGKFDRIEPLVELLAGEQGPVVRQEIALQLGHIGARMTSGEENGSDHGVESQEVLGRRLMIIDALTALESQDDREVVCRAGLEAAGGNPIALSRLGLAIAPRNPAGAAEVLPAAIAGLVRMGEWSPEAPPETGPALFSARLELARIHVAGLVPADESTGSTEAERRRAQLELARDLAEACLASPSGRPDLDAWAAAIAGDVYWELAHLDDGERPDLDQLDAARQRYDAARGGLPEGERVRILAAGRIALARLARGEVDDARAMRVVTKSELSASRFTGDVELLEIERTLDAALAPAVEEEGSGGDEESPGEEGSDGSGQDGEGDPEPDPGVTPPPPGDDGETPEETPRGEGDQEQAFDPGL